MTTAINWNEPLEHIDGTPVRLANIADKLTSHNPDAKGDYYLIREDGKKFTDTQNGFTATFLIVRPNGSRWISPPPCQPIIRNRAVAAPEWGEPITIKCGRPDWYRNENIQYATTTWLHSWYDARGDHVAGWGLSDWEHVSAIRLPADHPHYHPAPESFGEPILIDGKKPDWYRGEQFDWEGGVKDYMGIITGRAHKWNASEWSCIHAIRLPADHPYYLATSKGFTYWPGGDAAPGDLGDEILLDDRHNDQGVSVWRLHGDNVSAGLTWPHCKNGEYSNIIGYKPRTKSIIADMVKDTETITVRTTPFSGWDTAPPIRGKSASLYIVDEAQWITPTKKQRKIATLVNENDRLNKRVEELLAANNALVEKNRNLKVVINKAYGSLTANNALAIAIQTLRAHCNSEIKRANVNYMGGYRSRVNALLKCGDMVINAAKAAGIIK